MLRSRRATRSSWPAKSILRGGMLASRAGSRITRFHRSRFVRRLISGDLIFAVIAQQPDLHRALVEVSAGELLDAVPQDRSGDGSGVDLVGLAGLALAASGLPHQSWGDPHDSLAAGHERPLEVMGDVPAVLQRPDHVRVDLVRPAQRLAVPVVIRGDLSFAAHLARAGVDGREGVGALVGIRSDHDHSACPFNRVFV